MTITVSPPSNGKRTLTWTVTAPSQIVLDISDDAVHYYWLIGYGRHGTPDEPVVWEQITSSEKLIILNKVLVDIIRDAASTFNVVNSIDGVDAVRQEKLIESTTKYDVDPSA